MKKLSKILAFLSIAALFAAGAAFAAPMQLTMGTGGTAGTYYPLGGALSQIISDNSGGAVNITAQSTGASIENINLLAAGDVDLIIVQNDMSDYAYNGTEFFKDRKIENITAIARLYPEHIQVIASKDSGIKSIADLKGKRLSVGAPRSGTELNARAILNAAGIKYEDLGKIEYLPFAESVELMKNRQLDATLLSSGLGVAAVRDLATALKIVVIPIPAEVVAKIGDAAYQSGTIPANTYNGQTTDVNTVLVPNYLVTHAGVSEEMVYKMTKSMAENLDTMATAHAAAKAIKKEKMANGSPVPLHPGAEKYYREAGLLK